MSAETQTMQSPQFNNHINFLVNKFYEFMGECYVQYKLNPPENNQQFVDYFLYKLYFNYGVKRRYLYTADMLAQFQQEDAQIQQDVNTEKPKRVSPYVVLYYVKSLKGYKTNEPITQLCRHLIINTNNMRIISLGIPKSIKIDDFLQRYEIERDNLDTSFIKNDAGERDKIKYRVYKFPEGTMITYNPSMRLLNTSTITTQTDVDNEENDEGDVINHSQQQLAEENMKRQYSEFIKYSTRKIVGTGRFTSMKTFAMMFEENNHLSQANLDKIPDEIIADTVLVFNIEHPENKMIAASVRNCNTLCAVYRFKNETLVKQQWDAIKAISFNEEQIGNIKAAFRVLGEGMVTQIHVANFKKQVAQFGVNLYLPEVISSFEKQNSETVGERVVVPIDTITIEQLVNIVGTKNKQFQGFIIYGINGERTKIVNPRYRELRELKGNKPITLEPWNMKNLFFIYWKLMKEGKIETFLGEFQNEMYCYGPNNYANMFGWFAECVRSFARGLYNTYQNAFVKRSMAKYDIPFTMKPLCGELHKAYTATKLPTSITMVEQFMFNMPAGKVFWRIFGGSIDNQQGMRQEQQI